MVEEGGRVVVLDPPLAPPQEAGYPAPLNAYYYHQTEKVAEKR